MVLVFSIAARNMTFAFIVMHFTRQISFLTALFQSSGHVWRPRPVLEPNGQKKRTRVAFNFNWSRW
ncbi:hypothetical protein OA90_15440 [Labrenzia sp. OB1]|nr:hypothetical protein OA90_15440 [Labrenzia sp. OB1]